MLEAGNREKGSSAGDLLLEPSAGQAGAVCRSGTAGRPRNLASYACSRSCCLSDSAGKRGTHRGYSSCSTG